MSELVKGIIERALVFVLRQVAPLAASATPGIFGSLLTAAIKTDYVQGLEARISERIGQLSSDELAKFEAEAIGWADKEFKLHPEFAAFIHAVMPPPSTKIDFNLETDELNAVLAAKSDGTLRTKLGLT